MVAISSDLRPAEIPSSNFTSATLSSVSFESVNLTGSIFNDSLLDGVNFRSAVLSLSTFCGALLSDVAISGAVIDGADFHGTDPDITLIVDDEIAGQTRSRLVGEDALGYLQLHGAKTDHVPSHRVLRWAPEYAIVEMISSKLLERSPRQRRGLEQRGIASQNLKFAKSFMQLLEAEGFVITPSARSETVEITALGRSALGAIVGGRGLNGAIEGLLRGHQ